MTHNMQPAEKPEEQAKPSMTLEQIDARKLEIVEEVKRSESLIKTIKEEALTYAKNAELDKADKAYSDMEIIERKIRRLQEESVTLFEQKKQIII